jgi:hypothetical protein
MRRAEGLWMLLLLALLPGRGLGYDPEVHQRLTFYAAKVLNRCLGDSEVAPLTPLQVRFIATSNMGLANSNALVRFFRWSYFDIADRDDRKVLWLINTRFLNHFEEVAGNVRSTRDPTERYRELGRVVSYVQLVSSPSRAVPVYAARFWRWSFGDRFDGYPVSDQALEAALDEDCSFLAEPPDSYRAVLYAVAADTVEAVRSPIGGLPTTWESFWQPGQAPGDFGDYGSAGNSFGRKVEFPCAPDRAEQCVLLENDPLYAEFALERQLAAIRGTAQAMYLHQLRHVEAPLPERIADFR